MATGLTVTTTAYKMNLCCSEAASARLFNLEKRGLKAKDHYKKKPEA